MKARFAALSFEVAPNTPDQFGRIIREEIRRVGEVVKAANLRIDMNDAGWPRTAVQP